MNQPAAAPLRDRILDLQILRFVAAAGVLLSHAADVTKIASGLFWQIPWTAGVDIFFVISGIIMTILTANRFGRAGEASLFLVRRIIRIVPIYWLFTALMIAAALLLHAQVRHSHADPASILTSLLFVPMARGDGQIVPILSQGWTLNYEAFFYFAFTLALLHRRGLGMLVGGFVLLAAAHFVLPEGWVALYFWSNPIILEFVAGIGLARLWLGGLRLKLAPRLGLAAASILLFLGSGPLGFDHFGRLIANGIPAALLAATFLLGERDDRFGPLRRALIAGGDASYALYLSHTFTINLAMLAVGASIGGWPAMAIAVAAALIVAILVHRLVERPILDALHHRFGAPGRGV